MLHAVPQATWDTTGAFQVGLCICNFKLVGSRGQDNSFIDTNEHILNGRLPNDLHSLGLLETTHKHWAKDEPRTYIHGNRAPIDGVFHMPDLEIMSVLQLSFHEGVSNHRMV